MIRLIVECDTDSDADVIEDFITDYMHESDTDPIRLTVEKDFNEQPQRSDH